MNSRNALGLMVAVLAVGALVSESAFANRGGHGHRGGHFHGGHVVKGHGGHFHKVHGGHFHRSRVVVGIGVGGPVWGPGWWGPGWWGPGWGPAGWGPGWWGPAPTTVFLPGPTYIEQGGEQAPSATAAPAQQQPSHWWYYCADAKAYYPYVRECPGGWQRVSPEPPAPSR